MILILALKERDILQSHQTYNYICFNFCNIILEPLHLEHVYHIRKYDSSVSKNILILINKFHVLMYTGFICVQQWEAYG